MLLRFRARTARAGGIGRASMRIDLRRAMRRTELPVILVLLTLIGCGGPPGGVQHGGGAARPPTVTESNVHDVERTFWLMAQNDPSRTAWRDALFAYRNDRSAEILARGDYDQVVQHLANLTELLSPTDIEIHNVPTDVGPLAQWVARHGARRGDEGRVLGALLLLSAIGEQPELNDAERERVAQWSRDARSHIDNPIERFGGLIQVWEQYEQVAPSPDVLSTLARLYVEQRDALLGAFGPEGQGSSTAGRLSMQELHLAPMLVQRAPLDVAAVYLRHGDLEHAIEQVQRMGNQGGVEADLVTYLQSALRDDERGATSLNELAQGFARARPSIAAAICRVGARRFPHDARFTLCLARVAIQERHPGEATSWYAEAIQLSPEERSTYDEALGQLGEMMEQGLLGSDAGEGRAVAEHALAILDARARRWPDAPSAVTREELLMALARAAMNEGDVGEARQQLEASLEAHETSAAHQQLGILLERTGEPRDAAVHYRSALDMTGVQDMNGRAERAELLEHLGDAFREAGDGAQSRRMYGEAMALWNQLGEQIEGAQTAIVQVRLGVLQSRLGHPEQAAEAFNEAMDAAPSWRDPYAAILSHLVVSAPNLELAQQVLRRAQSHLTLEPEWKVYFALWVQAIAERAAAQPEQDIASLLSDEAHGDSWSARLAAFGTGSVEPTTLVSEAQGRRQQAEAHFYAGTRMLGTGDLAGARAQFEQVLTTGMIGDYEFAMAQELLGAIRSDAAQASSPHADAGQR